MGVADFRYPYQIEAVLEPWREVLGDSYDEVVALLADRDRALEDHIDNDHQHDGSGVDSTLVRPSDDTSSDAAGDNSVAVGDSATAVTDDSIAIGSASDASGGDGAIAIGASASATNTAAIAIGDAAEANLDRAVAVGHSADASGADSVVVGALAGASAASTVAVGSNSHGDESGATAVGANTDADAVGATAIGSDSAAHGQNSTALGAGADASHQNATALGANVSTTGTEQVTIGQRRLFQGVPNSAVTDSHVSTGQLSFYLDETGDILKGRARYSDGTTLKTFQVGTSAPVTDHDDLTGVSADDHHDKEHAHDGADGSGTVSHDDLTGVSADDHHAQSHVLTGSDHTASGLTAGHVLRATAATTFAFGALQDADVPSTIARDSEVVLQSLADAKGDLIAASGDGVWVRLPVGTDDQVLTADSGETAGVKWADASGGGGSGDGLVPYFIPSGETYTVPEYRQALFVEPIDVEGVLDVEGLLIEVTQAPDLSAQFHMQTSL